MYCCIQQVAVDFCFAAWLCLITVSRTPLLQSRIFDVVNLNREPSPSHLQGGAEGEEAEEEEEVFPLPSDDAWILQRKQRERWG